MFYNLGSDGQAIGMTASQEAIDTYAAGRVSKEEFR
jgi:hypothetical protein